MLGSDHQAAGPGLDWFLAEQTLNTFEQGSTAGTAQPHQQQAVMGAWNVFPCVGEVQILRNQEAAVALRSGPDVGVAMAGQMF